MEQQGRPGQARAPAPAAGTVSWSDGGPPCGFPAAGIGRPARPVGRRRGKTPNAHGGRTSIDNVVVQRVRRRAATTTTKGRVTSFAVDSIPKKPGGPHRRASTRGSRCATTGSVVSTFFPGGRAAAIVSRSVDPSARRRDNNALPQGQLREIRVFDLRRGPADARREKSAAGIRAAEESRPDGRAAAGIFRFKRVFYA